MYTPSNPGRKVHTRQVGSMGGVKDWIGGMFDKTLLNFELQNLRHNEFR